MEGVTACFREYVNRQVTGYPVTHWNPPPLLQQAIVQDILTMRWGEVFELWSWEKEQWLGRLPTSAAAFQSRSFPSFPTQLKNLGLGQEALAQASKAPHARMRCVRVVSFLAGHRQQRAYGQVCTDVKEGVCAGLGGRSNQSIHTRSTNPTRAGWRNQRAGLGGGGRKQTAISLSLGLWTRGLKNNLHEKEELYPAYLTSFRKEFGGSVIKPPI